MPFSSPALAVVAVLALCLAAPAFAQEPLTLGTPYRGTLPAEFGTDETFSSSVTEDSFPLVITLTYVTNDLDLQVSCRSDMTDSVSANAFGNEEMTLNWGDAGCTSDNSADTLYIRVFAWAGDGGSFTLRAHTIVVETGTGSYGETIQGDLDSGDESAYEMDVSGAPFPIEFVLTSSGGAARLGLGCSPSWSAANLKSQASWFGDGQEETVRLPDSYPGGDWSDCENNKVWAIVLGEDDDITFTLGSREWVDPNAGLSTFVVILIACAVVLSLTLIIGIYCCCCKGNNSGGGVVVVTAGAHAQAKPGQVVAGQPVAGQPVAHGKPIAAGGAPAPGYPAAGGAPAPGYPAAQAGYPAAEGAPAYPAYPAAGAPGYPPASGAPAQPYGQ